jgi:hypothetical protein
VTLPRQRRYPSLIGQRGLYKGKQSALQTPPKSMWRRVTKMSIPERICSWCHTLSTIAIVVPDEPYLGEVPEIVTTKPNGDSRTGNRHSALW